MSDKTKKDFRNLLREKGLQIIDKDDTRSSGDNCTIIYMEQLSKWAKENHCNISEEQIDEMMELHELDGVLVINDRTGHRRWGVFVLLEGFTAYKSVKKYLVGNIKQREEKELLYKIVQAISLK